ncbi:hypothetical protein GCM10027347_15710 [Larkinella harenae]
MKFLYSLLLLVALSCQSPNTTTSKPDAYRDLLIDRMVWKKSEPSHSAEKPLNVHRFTLTNSSDSYSYEKIEVRFDYFDSTYHKISSSKQILDKAIGPRAALAVGEIQDGPTLAGTKSATVTIVDAVAHESAPEN